MISCLKSQRVLSRDDLAKMLYVQIKLDGNAQSNIDHLNAVFGPNKRSDYEAYGELFYKAADMILSQLFFDENTIQPGMRVDYVIENTHLSLPATVLNNVEGWWQVEFDDKSTAIVRPSHLRFNYLRNNQ